ncbi:MAG: DUF2063 domain-containing protein [Gammaproteobacteria bacterium CG_4_10_14_0_8_um_filter_38_16]|nr:MAG: DUF2063 domain-containing protein [Gammaproteobacteria bacterium CG_4_10_14_0_8_um_filter_38_16]PJA04419.1 MAG: DUF2063 domain-containing protein [Gammaproteobacteria bacterium CG_4_10_14_0_2_um_filter_38_22]PJB10159.1 MAG: DUF2063 domain-containing protein [Gammaproteobacteria bacterium CG_4_9_14_3_um_filter_38_9]
MTSFYLIQEQFQRYVMSNDESIFNQVLGTQKVPKETRLAIYQNAYYLRLKESLETSYPLLKKYLGDQAFEKYANAYIEQFPSTYRSIRWFGDQFAFFLKQQSSYKKKPYLFELANLEWKSALVFDAENAPVLQLEKMASVSPDLWPTIIFKIHPTVQRISLCWNMVAIWQAFHDEKKLLKPIKNPEPMTWILWRKALMTQFISVAADEAYALQSLAAGNTFSALCEKLCELLPENEVGQRAAVLLKRWITMGLIEDDVQ